MTHVITQSCCNDAACVDVCPVDCIHPRPADPRHRAAEILHIDPTTCIDCGACTDVCPVDAIVPDDMLDLAGQHSRSISEAYFDAARRAGTTAPAVSRPPAASEPRELAVAIVGTGPAGYYAATELLARTGGRARVALFDRLPVPGGLVRYGVAPDHVSTKAFGDGLERLARQPSVRLLLNVEVGEHITTAELLEHHHAVVYAVGASAERRLGVPGEDLPGSSSAREFVAWYNGHPDFADREFPLAAERAVVIGNGNVALDVARILVTGTETLARTDMAPHAVAALAASGIREVHVIGRRGPARSAFTTPELLGLDRVGGAQVLVPPAEAHADPTGDFTADLKVRVIAGYARQAPDPARRRVLLRFGRTPTQIIGDSEGATVRGIRLRTPDGGDEVLECGLVLRAIGYRGTPVPGLPFDPVPAAVPHRAGRVVGGPDSTAVPGLYVTGWIKRGPSGVIGTNRLCAAETVASLLTDHAAGLLAAPRRREPDLDALLALRSPQRVERAGWQAIDRHEKLAGRRSGTPRRKLVSVEQMLAVAANRAAG